MCGVTPATSPLPHASVPAGTIATDPTATGGGITTPPQAPSLDTATIIPVLQQLVTVLQALATALQGAGAITPGAATGAMGAPSAAAAGATAGAAGAQGGGPPAKGGGANAMPGMKMGGDHGAHADEGHHHGMKIIQRSTAPNPALAQKNFSAVYSTFRSHTRQGLEFRNNNTHGYLPKTERDAYHRANPGLPVPESLVFREGSNTPIGIVFRSTTAGPSMDLGAGDRHDHTGDKGNSQMQHIWFTPNNLDFAFSDVEHGMTGSTAAAMKKMGYPT
ncbi:MAG: hypothetical protein JWL76_1197 [Thermoleophilia bacterium]|nr:hypothetical protein [Thermoleophilia bacterium]